jgi:hypothetical protein
VQVVTNGIALCDCEDPFQRRNAFGWIDPSSQHERIKLEGRKSARSHSRDIVLTRRLQLNLKSNETAYG